MNGDEYIYKERSFTGLAEISQRLEVRFTLHDEFAVEVFLYRIYTTHSLVEEWLKF